MANNQGLQRLLIASSGDNVIWDRCFIHGYAKPSRFHKGMSLRGRQVAVIDSVFHGFQEWRSKGYSQSDSSHAIAHYSGGPAIIRNNSIEAAGINYIAPNGSYSEEGVHDVTIENNDFVKRPEWRQTELQTTLYPNRHPLELKQGQRFLIAANRFTYQWSGINAGAMLELTPRASSIPAAATITSVRQGVVTVSPSVTFDSGDVVLISGTFSHYDGLQEVESSLGAGVFRLRGAFAGDAGSGSVQNVAPGRPMSDIDIRDNLFYQGTELLRVAGIDGDASVSLAPTTRVRLAGNLVVDLNILPYSWGGRVDRSGTYVNGDFGARVVYVLNGEMEDLHIQNNTVFGVSGNRPTLLVSSQQNGKTVMGLRLERNIVVADSLSSIIRTDDGKALGSAALTAMFPGAQLGLNVLCCAPSVSQSYGEGFIFPAGVDAIRWVRPSLVMPFNFVLSPGSPFTGSGASAQGLLGDSYTVPASSSDIPTASNTVGGGVSPSAETQTTLPVIASTPPVAPPAVSSNKPTGAEVVSSGTLTVPVPSGGSGSACPE